MSFDLQLMRDTAPASVTMLRDLAIYRDVQSADRKTQRARNIADLLERGHRPRTNGKSGVLIDIRA